MPGTINGIGTTYFGKKKLKTEAGRCAHCGREGLLASYETRLWFSFVFIPVIPLSRKQILDYCPACTRHKALPLAEWQRIEREAVRGAIERTEKSPDDPAAAMELLGTLVGFKRREEAAQFAEIMAGSFPDHAGVQMQLGAWHEIETGLGRSESALPPKPRRIGRWVLGGAVAAALLIGMFVWNRSIRSSPQPLYVVNGLSGPVSVAIDNGQPFDLAAAGRRKLILPEGSHQAAIRRPDGAEDLVEFTLENGFFERFGQDTVFVLNPGGAATLLWEEILYSANPDPNHQNLAKVHFAEEFTALRDIDYAFEEPPAELKTESKRLTKAVVRWLPVAPVDILVQMPQAASFPEAMRFGEHQLGLRPNDVNLIDTYVFLAAGHDQLERAVSFLEAGLARRPVPVEWHRRYQEWKRRTGDEPGVLRRYDEMLAEDPDDAALLYLRGRLELRTADAIKFYDRSIAAQPELPFPYAAKAFHLASAGELAAARQLAAKARQLDPENAGAEELFFEIRFCLEEYAELEQEVLEATRRQPLDIALHARLLAVLLAEGRADEARAAHETFVQRVRGELPDQAAEAVPLAEAVLLYLSDDLQGYLQLADRFSDPTLAGNARFTGHLELGEPEEAEKHFDPAALMAGRNALLLDLAWCLAGKPDRAEPWRRKAIESLKTGTQEDRWAAGLLERAAEVDLREVDEVALRREMKVALLAALAADSSEHRQELLAKAKQLNAVDTFPHRFLGRVIEGLGQ